MDPGNSTSERWRTGYKMCEHGGNISIVGLCCVNAQPPTVYFTVVIQPSALPRSRLNRSDVELAFICQHTWSTSTALSKGMGLSDCEEVISSHRHVCDIRCWQSSTISGLCPPLWRLVASPTHSIGRDSIVGWGDSSCSGIQTWHQSLLSLYVRMR